MNDSSQHGRGQSFGDAAAVRQAPLAALWRHKYILIATVVVFVAVTAFLSKVVLEKEYEATATMWVTADPGHAELRRGPGRAGARAHLQRCDRERERGRARGRRAPLRGHPRGGQAERPSRGCARDPAARDHRRRRRTRPCADPGQHLCGDRHRLRAHRAPRSGGVVDIAGRRGGLPRAAGASATHALHDAGGHPRARGRVRARPARRGPGQARALRRGAGRDRRGADPGPGCARAQPPRAPAQPRGLPGAADQPRLRAAGAAAALGGRGQPVGIGRQELGGAQPGPRHRRDRGHRRGRRGRHAPSDSAGGARARGQRAADAGSLELPFRPGRALRRALPDRSSPDHVPALGPDASGGVRAAGHREGPDPAAPAGRHRRRDRGRHAAAVGRRRRVAAGVERQRDDRRGRPPALLQEGDSLRLRAVAAGGRRVGGPDPQPRPRDRWRVRLLLRRGPAYQEAPEPVRPRSRRGPARGQSRAHPARGRAVRKPRAPRPGPRSAP